MRIRKGGILKKILLLSHGNMSVETLKSSQLILGEVPGVSAIPLIEGENLEDYEENVKKELLGNNETLVLIDLFGGTPFMRASKIYSELEHKEKIKIITGMNLPMLLELMVNLNDKNLNELADIAVDYGRKGIVNLSDEEIKNGN